MSTPRPGRPVRGSQGGRPLMALLDLLGRRWALRLLWELRDGPIGFASLQARCDGVSPSVLSQRLRELREAHLIEIGSDRRYQLDSAAAELGEILLELDGWSKRWGRRLGSAGMGSVRPGSSRPGARR